MSEPLDKPPAPEGDDSVNDPDDVVKVNEDDLEDTEDLDEEDDDEGEDG